MYNTDLQEPFIGLFSALIQTMGVAQFDMLITRMVINKDVLLGVYEVLEKDKIKRLEKKDDGIDW